MKYSGAIPYVAVALVVFLAVASAFVCYGICDAKNNAESKETTVADFIQKNIFVSVQNSDTNTLDTNLIVSIDPKNSTIKGIVIPADTRINIASSDQMFKDVINIGGVEMMREVIEDIVPLPIDYHLIIKTSDFPEHSGNYEGFLRSIFTDVLWQQSDLNSYLTQILNIANTDLTLMRVDEYASYINNFVEHSNDFYTLPGSTNLISERYFYVIDQPSLHNLINTQILN